MEHNELDNTSCTTFLFSDRSLEAALDAIGEAGFPQAEINVSDPHVGTPTEQEQSRLRALFEGHSVSARTMHAPLGRNVLGATDEEWRLEVVDVLRQHVRLAGALGLTEVVIHPIPNPDLVADAADPMVKGRISDAVRRSLDDLMPTIEDAGVCATLENLPYLSDFPLQTMKELRALVDAYPSDSLGLVIDTGHIGVLELDPVEELHAAGERLRGTHLHDIDLREGRVDHHTLTLGNLDWTAMRKAFSDIGYLGPWTSEVIRAGHGESPEELARETHQWMSSWLQGN